VCGLRPGTDNPVLALLTADWHLTLTPPVARSVEANWLDRQWDYLNQLRLFQINYGNPHAPLPILFAGDLFDKWNVPSELVNWAIRALPPNLYGVPGQHDLPHHRLEDIKKSSFWTLVEAGKVHYLEPHKPVDLAGHTPLRLFGFPWGCQLTPRRFEVVDSICLNVAVVHQYLWIKGRSYVGADERCRARNFKKGLKGYDVAVFGDNHQSFNIKVGDCLVHNCGGFQRRKADEVGYQPTVGLLHADGTITRKKLNCQQDQFVEQTELAVLQSNWGSVEDFMAELASLSDVAINFAEALEMMFRERQVTPEVRQVVLQAMEKKKR
jgi:hypothetical protein